jgi:hypothetical protein
MAASGGSAPSLGTDHSWAQSDIISGEKSSPASQFEMSTFTESVDNSKPDFHEKSPFDSTRITSKCNN